MRLRLNSRIKYSKTELVIDEFQYSLCCSYNTALKNYQYGATHSTLPFDIDDWLKEHIGKGNYIFGFEDYGQHGEWMLHTRSREDLLAFKLRWVDR